MNAEAVSNGRARALHDVERAERLYKAAFFGAVAVEAVLLVSLLLLLDFQNATHKLLAIGFVGSYSIVVLAIVALGAHVSRLAQRILRAIELTKG
jgi:hypothetical protein